MSVCVGGAVSVCAGGGTGSGAGWVCVGGGCGTDCGGGSGSGCGRGVTGRGAAGMGAEVIGGAEDNGGGSVPAIVPGCVVAVGAVAVAFGSSVNAVVVSTFVSVIGGTVSPGP